MYLDGNSGRRPGHAVHTDITPECWHHGRTAASASGEGWTQSRRKGSGAWNPQSSFCFRSRILLESDSENPGPDVEPGPASANPRVLFAWSVRRPALPFSSGPRGRPPATQVPLQLAPCAFLTFTLYLDFSKPELTLVPL